MQGLWNAWDIGDESWVVSNKTQYKIIKTFKNHILLFPQGLWSVVKHPTVESCLIHLNNKEIEDVFPTEIISSWNRSMCQLKHLWYNLRLLLNIRLSLSCFSWTWNGMSMTIQGQRSMWFYNYFCHFAFLWSHSLWGWSYLVILLHVISNVLVY